MFNLQIRYVATNDYQEKDSTPYNYHLGRSNRLNGTQTLRSVHSIGSEGDTARCAQLAQGGTLTAYRDENNTIQELESQ